MNKQWQELVEQRDVPQDNNDFQKIMETGFLARSPHCFFPIFKGSVLQKKRT